MGEDPQQQYRRAIGAFATGVAVVTAAREDGQVSGITINSLTSVSLEPLLVLWCLGDQSERYDVFARAELWGFAILGASEQELARRFSKADFETLESERTNWLAGAPVLNGGVVRFACATRERRQAGDHLIIIGEVLDFEFRGGAGLIFVDGRYGQANMGSE